MTRTPVRFAVLASVLFALIAPAAAQTLGEREPSSTGAFLLGRAALGDLRVDQVKDYMINAAEAFPTNGPLASMAARLLTSAGEIDKAAPLAATAVSSDPTDGLAQLVLATVDMRNGKFLEVSSRMARIISANTLPGIAGAALSAWAQVGAGQYDRTGATLAPLSSAGLRQFLQFHRALMADIAGQRDVAITTAQRALDTDISQARVVETLARLYAEVGRFDTALSIIGRYEAEGLSDPTIDSIKPLIQMGQKPGVLLTTAQQGAAELFHAIGMLLASDGNFDVSIVMMRLGQYLDPNSAVIAFNLGRVFAQAEQFEVANGLFELIPETSPLRGQATVLAAANLDELGDRSLAIAQLRALVVSSPRNVDALSSLGDLLTQDKQFLAAAEVYSQIIDIVGGTRPRDWRYFYVRAVVYTEAEQWPLAEADFLKALQLNPEEPRVLNYLGYSWVDRGEHLDQALAMIEKAVAALPEEGYIVDSLGWAYYRLGRFEEAVETLERAVQLDPNDSHLNDHLGDAYWMVGRKREAVFQWTIARDLDPQGDIVDKVLHKLANGLDAPVPMPMAS